MNDMTTFATRDDVLTLLIHLGYLTYNSERHTASIPNREVSQEYMNAISTMNWHDVISSVNDSRKLLEAMWNIEKITKQNFPGRIRFDILFVWEVFIGLLIGFSIFQRIS